MSNRTLIYYVIPEDDDDFEHPNVFAIHKSVKQLTIGEVVEAFPLPGVYHFRFKTAFMKTFVWEDGVDMGSIVPTYKGGVSLKVSRLRPVDNTRNNNNNPADEYVYVEKKSRNETRRNNNNNNNNNINNKYSDSNVKTVNRNKNKNNNNNNNKNVNNRQDDGPQRRNSTDDLLDMFGNYNDGNSLNVNNSKSSSSVLSGGDLDDLDFGTSPPNTPMETTNLQPVGVRQSSAPAMINTNANSLGSRSSSLNSTKTNSPRSSLVDELIGGNGFNFNLNDK